MRLIGLVVGWVGWWLGWLVGCVEWLNLRLVEKNLAGFARQADPET